MSDEPVVLDASALLALLRGEPGAEVVAARLAGAVMSAVNLSEVAAKLADYGVPGPDLRGALDGLGLDVRPFDAEAAYVAGELRRRTRAAGLSLGDRACLGLAMQLGLVAMTAARAWGGLDGVAVRVEVVR